MISQLIHPELMAHIAATHCNSLISVSTPVKGSDAANEETVSYIPDSTLVNIPAYIEPTIGMMGSQEQRNQDQTVVSKTVTIMLAGYYPTIGEEYQLVDDVGRVYNVLTVGTDDTNTTTWLVCERVNPETYTNA